MLLSLWHKEEIRWACKNWLKISLKSYVSLWSLSTLFKVNSFFNLFIASGEIESNSESHCTCLHLDQSNTRSQELNSVVPCEWHAVMLLELLSAGFHIVHYRKPRFRNVARHSSVRCRHQWQYLSHFQMPTSVKAFLPREEILGLL